MKVNEVKGFKSFAKEWYGDTGQHEKDRLFHLYLQFTCNLLRV